MFFAWYFLLIVIPYNLNIYQIKQVSMLSIFPLIITGFDYYDILINVLSLKCFCFDIERSIYWNVLFSTVFFLKLYYTNNTIYFPNIKLHVASYDIWEFYLFTVISLLHFLIEMTFRIWFKIIMLMFNVNEKSLSLMRNFWKYFQSFIVYQWS